MCIYIYIYRERDRYMYYNHISHHAACSLAKQTSYHVSYQVLLSWLVSGGMRYDNRPDRRRWAERPHPTRKSLNIQ